ncbi:MAG: hypothetical protein AAF409_13530 [Pseudomonadota bacterium]
MLNRREFIGTTVGAGCAICSGTPGWAGQIALAGSPSTIGETAGCLVAPSDFTRDKLGSMGIGHTVSSFTVSGKRFQVSSTSGNPHFDRALVEALYHVSKTFDVLPTFGFIKGGNVANAFATTTPFSPEAGDSPLPTREHGTVLFGDKMLDLMRQKGIDNPVAAVLAIIAHEFGHIVQYNYQFNGKHLIQLLTDGQPTVKLAELHADFLTGYYVGTAKRRNPDTPAASVALAAHVIGDYQTNAPSHHGTPAERGQAVYAGYRASWEQNLPFDQAAVAGLAHVGVIQA